MTNAPRQYRRVGGFGTELLPSDVATTPKEVVLARKVKELKRQMREQEMQDILETQRKQDNVAD